MGEEEGDQASAAHLKLDSRVLGNVEQQVEGDWRVEREGESEGGGEGWREGGREGGREGQLIGHFSRSEIQPPHGGCFIYTSRKEATYQ